MNTVLLLTGVPGVGKTTLIKRLAAKLTGIPLAGFYTEEIRVSRQRVGFKLVGFGGESGVIADVDLASPHRVGRYGVDVGAIDRLAGATLARDAEVYLIDEIGKMECLSEVFMRRLGQLLTMGKPVIATVAKTGGGFIEAVKRRPEVELWEVTCGNRDKLVAQALAWLKQRGISP